MKTHILLVLAVILFHSCKTLHDQSKTLSPQIENRLQGELDYSKGGFELVNWQNGGDEITLGRIDEQGSIHIDLPDYDIRALGRNHNGSSLESQFMMVKCKGKGDYDRMGQPLFKTPYDDVYSQMYRPMYVKKYGLSMAYVSPITDERMLVKGNFDKIIGSKYFWMYIDRDLDYQETCIRTSFKDPNLEFELTADVAFKKGWNFIKRELVEVQKYGDSDDQVTPKRIHFTIGDLNSEEVKWYLVRAKSSEKIQAAKKEYERERG